MYIKNVIFSLVICLSNQVCFSQLAPLNDNPLKTNIDSSVQSAAIKYFSDGKAVGLTIGIIYRGNSSVYHYGENIKGSNRLPSDDLYYNIGSIAKTFDGTLLAQAVIDNKVNLNDDVRKYLPGSYPNLQYLGHPITIVSLANHTSGLPGVIRPLLPKEVAQLRNMDLAAQAKLLSAYNADSLLDELHKIKPDTIPGSIYRYNSNAVMLLQFILERIYRKGYNELITSFLQRHLKMYNTAARLSGLQLRQTAQGHNKNEDPQSYVNIGGYYIGPNMNATFTDLMIYLKAQIAEKDPAVKLTHQRTYCSQQGFAIGLNWMIDSENGIRYIYHDGNSKLGFNSLCTIYPKEKLGFFIVANDVYSQEKVGTIENKLYNAFSHHN